MPRPEFNPLFFGGDFIFSIIIVTFCLLIYCNTKEISKLTKHKGITYFRNAFFLLSIAYIIRLILTPWIFHKSFLSIIILRRSIMPLSLVIISFFSTMAMFSLFLSATWKKIKIKNLYWIASIVAFVISFCSFFYKEFLLLIITQLTLLILTIIFCLIALKETKKLPKLFTVYILLFIFWIFNLFPLSTQKFLPQELTFPIQIISLIILIIIFYKVKKWTK